DVSTGLSLLMTTIVFGFAAETAVIRFTWAADIAFTAEIVCPSYGVPGGEAAAVLTPAPVLTKTIAWLLPTAAAPASAMAPLARVYASLMLAGPHGADTAGTAGLPPAAAAAGVETQLVASFTVIEIG